MTALAVKMSKKPFVHGFISKNWEFKIALYLNLNR